MPKAVSNMSLFNSIYDTLSPNFQARIPKMDAQNMATIGMLITSDSFKAEMNEWLTEAVNRIGMVLIRETSLRNRLEKYVYGTMEFGDAIEELCVQIAKAEDYTQPANGASIDPFRTTYPEVKALYHRVNSRRKYRATTFPNQVKRAFLNEGGIGRLFANITDSLIKGAKADDYDSIKEIFNFYINDTTKLPAKPTQKVAVPQIVDEASAKTFINTLKDAFSAMLFPTGSYNQMGIIQTSEPSEMTLFIRSWITNYISVEVLSAAFNRDDLDFTPEGTSRVKIELMPDFGGTYPVNASGTKLLPIYNEFGMTTGQYSANGQLPADTIDHMVDPNENVYAILADDRFLIITRQLERMETIYNPDGLYWNEIYHKWSQYGYTGFYNNIQLIADTASRSQPLVTGFTAEQVPGTNNVKFTVTGTNLFDGMAINPDGQRAPANTIQYTSGDASVQTATVEYGGADDCEAQLLGQNMSVHVVVTDQG